MFNKKPLLILVGPTAVGKTKISIDIAKKMNAEIISADSMQIYKHMDIGTAKIKENEKEGIMHYLIDEIYPNEQFTVSDYQQRTERYIETILNKGKVPMIVGGTGLYINSLVYNLDFSKAVSNPKLREKFEKLAHNLGNKYILSELDKVDSKSAQRIHENDTKRIIRALEVYYETGVPMSESYNKFREPNPKYDISYIGLNRDRKTLYNRINKRVDIMIDEGLQSEVLKLREIGYDFNSTALQGLGYKEMIKYIEGEYSLDYTVEIIKRDSRRFAKRQLTWFKRDERIKWIKLDNYNDENEIINIIIKHTIENLKDNEIFNRITYNKEQS